VTLLHYLAHVVSQKDPDLFAWERDLPALRDGARWAVEGVGAEIRACVAPVPGRGVAACGCVAVAVVAVAVGWLAADGDGLAVGL
jgi:hypothetical protein